MHNKRNTIILYVITDLLSAICAWVLFFSFRKLYIEMEPIVFDSQFYKGIIVVPALWILLYALSGEYYDVYKKSRFREVYQTLVQSVIGTIILFFIILLDDFIKSYKDYYLNVAGLFGIHFTITLLVRMLFLYFTKRSVKKGYVSYRTIIIGGDSNALDIYQQIRTNKNKLGYNLVGFIDSNGKSNNLIAPYLPKLGYIPELSSVIRDHKIEEVIIAVENDELEKSHAIIDELSDEKVTIKLIPDVYSIITGSVKLDYPYGAILIEHKSEVLSPAQSLYKRCFDILFATVAIICLTPILIFAAIRVRLSSPGSIFYKQERIGRNGEPFNIIKFRSMYEDAEKNGPALSNDNDTRQTPWGKIMRKYRIDELPQFFNVLFGDMSIVGPRPERKFFIDQIVQRAPHYVYIHRVRPGITSWGMVQFGYASNVDEMIKRMKWDLLYVENISMALDIKILLYTIYTVLKGEGK